MKRITLQYEIKQKDNGVKYYTDVYEKFYIEQSPVFIRSKYPVQVFCHGHGWRSVIIFTVLHPKRLMRFEYLKWVRNLYSLNRQFITFVPIVQIWNVVRMRQESELRNSFLRKG